MVRTARLDIKKSFFNRRDAEAQKKLFDLIRSSRRLSLHPALTSAHARVQGAPQRWMFCFYDVIFGYCFIAVHSVKEHGYGSV